MKKKKATSFWILCLLLLMTFSAAAWFARVEKVFHSNPLTVDNPPVIFIRNFEADPDESVQVLTLENMKIGDTTYIPFCVVPRDDTIGAGSYRLQIAYTENMGEKIHLYKVTQISDTVSDGAVSFNNYYYTYDHTAMVFSEKHPVIQNEETQPYKGVYQYYDGLTFQHYLSTTNPETPALLVGGCLKENSVIRQNLIFQNPGSSAGEGNHQMVSFYLLEIVVPTGADPKETDLLYVYVSG